MFAHVTTQIEGRKYENLLSEKGFRGFPSLAALDENGDIIAKLSGGRDVEGFEKMMASGAKFMELRSKPEKTLDDLVFLLKHDIEMGNATLDAAKERMSKLEGLSEEQTDELNSLLLNLEVQAAVGEPRSREEYEANLLAAGPRFAAIFAEGREPSAEGDFANFFSSILMHAQKQGDAELFEKALGKLSAKFESERNKAFFDSKRADLEKLRSGGADDDDGEDADDESGDDDSDDDSEE